ncbi:MAG: YdbL family protein [Puniceicoccaceae bacterium]
MKKPILSFLPFLFLLAVLPGTALANPAKEATERIKDRLAQVDSMKAAGEVGEDAVGFLAPRSELGPRQQSILDAENADRRIIYAAIASRAGQTVEAVGQQRAIQIATRARPGVWLQKPDGEWYRKP